MKVMAKNAKKHLEKFNEEKKEAWAEAIFWCCYVIHALLKVVETRNTVNFDNPCKKWKVFQNL